MLRLLTLYLSPECNVLDLPKQNPNGAESTKWSPTFAEEEEMSPITDTEEELQQTEIPIPHNKIFFKNF